jgi:molybdenum cofactor biosynthesis enzyme MoaA
MACTFDFANILLGGPCNQRCPSCIGRYVDPALNQDTLDRFPLPNLDAFATLLREHGIHQVVLTGTNTDPQLYRHEGRLIHWLRERVPDAQLALHTNGQLALSKLKVLNMYDRATISFPSFNSRTFARMTGTEQMPDLEAIVHVARIPVKISCLVGEHNVDEVEGFVARCQEIGVRRVVLRQQYDPTRRDRAFVPSIRAIIRQAAWPILSTYRNNPVYNYRGVEVTCWDFDRTTSTSLNLFSDGSISTEYLLIRHRAA